MRALFESDEILKDIWVQGEISNFVRASSGHIYLTLKDSAAALKCVIWKTDAARLRYPLQNGLAVEAHGKIGIYERDGAYQLYIDTLRPVGEVTIPIRRGWSGSGRLRSASNNPSASRRALRRRNSR